jgi:hypothetical protein
MNFSSFWCNWSDCVHLGHFLFAHQELAICHRRIWAKCNLLRCQRSRGFLHDLQKYQHCRRALHCGVIACRRFKFSGTARFVVGVILADVSKVCISLVSRVKESEKKYSITDWPLMIRALRTFETSGNTTQRHTVTTQRTWIYDTAVRPQNISFVLPHTTASNIKNWHYYAL